MTWDVGRRHVLLMALRGIEVQPHGHGDNATDPPAGAPWCVGPVGASLPP